MKYLSAQAGPEITGEDNEIYLLKMWGKVAREEGEEGFTVFAHSPDTVEREK